MGTLASREAESLSPSISHQYALLKAEWYTDAVSFRSIDILM